MNIELKEITIKEWQRRKKKKHQRKQRNQLL